MRILVDAVPLSGLVTGISRYLRNLYQALESLEECTENCIEYFNGKRISRHMPPAAEPASWAKKTATLWKLPDPAVFTLRCAQWLKYEKNLRRLTQSRRYDIYHETGFSPAALSNTPQVFSLCDLSLLRYPETHPRERVWFSEFFRRRRMSYVKHILTLTQYMREEICEFLQWPLSRVSAVPLAPAETFRPRADTEVTAVRRSLQIPEHYLLFVGSLEPRKNLRVLIKALMRCRSDIHLVMVGWQGWGSQDWHQEVQNTKSLRNRMTMTGYLDDDTLACLYSGATALVYPSLYEGFGLPIVEAMACGCPVICSNVSSMPEVAGDAARLIDPRNPDDLATAIEEVVESSVTQKDLAQRGLARAATFTWRRTALETRQVFQAVIEENCC